MSLLNHRNFQAFLTVLLLLVVVDGGNADFWRVETEVPTSRNGVATAVVSGKIYIIGGVSYTNKGGPGWSALPAVEVYNTRTKTWRKAADIPTPRIAAQAAVFGGEIYVFGGYSRGEIRGDEAAQNR